MDPSLCPPDKQIVNLGVIGPVESANFQKWYDFYLDLVEELIPGFRDHVLFLDIHRTGKPLQQWTGRFKGDAVGVSQSVGQVGKDRPDPATPIEGLYLVGADVGTTGIGTELSALSALDAWKAIQGK
jgi:phytoene dehydrogenase-like protein